LQPRVLITGGAGFIGSHLAEAYLARGARVRVIDDLSTGRWENIAHLAANSDFGFAIDSVTNEIVLDRLVSECDLIVHLAAAVGVQMIVEDPLHVLETNIIGTHTLFRVANRYRRKVLIASTSEVYGKSQQVPFREDDDQVLGPTSRARWAYATSKAADEFLGLAYYRQKGLPVVIFRLFNTVGPRQTGQYGMVVPRFVRQALAGEPLTVYGDGEQSRCFCDVEDVVRAILSLADCDRAVGQVFNVGASREVTILELARKVLALTGAEDERITLVPYDQAYQPGFEDMRRRVPDTGRLRALTGWEPRVSLEETLRRVIASFEESAGGAPAPAGA
jgi:UDP-glucose 4-epimerase